MKNRIAALLAAIALFATTATACYAQDSQNTAAASAAFAKGKKEFESKKYKEAQKDLDIAAKNASRNSTIQYYLALAAQQNGDYATYRRALARIVVQNHTKVGIGNRAAQMLASAGSRPYTALNNGGFITRFTRKDMPIKVWISQGLMLPPAVRGKAPDRSQMSPLLKQLMQPTFYGTLEKDPGFSNTLYGCVSRGLSKWDWARSEGFLNYQMVNNPVTADILVFWCPSFQIPDTAGYTSKITMGKLGKVVMQFASKGNVPSNIQSTMLELNATHEFGHAFGLESHSPNADDIMTTKLWWTFQQDGTAVAPRAGITENDRATLRALYEIAPDVTR